MNSCGIDEAGRGPMLGPLVVAGVLATSSQIKQLKKHGVRDSKKLTPVMREKLYKKIIDTVENYHIVRIQPRTIDTSVKNHSLNHLEAKYMAKIILKLKPKVSFVDSCDANPVRFGKEISQLSKNSKIRSYHHADSKFIIVAAASILAKVSRDRTITRLKKNYDIGSGYPSDKKTVNFVKKSIRKNEIPSFVRKSWKPVQKMMKKKLTLQFKIVICT